MESLGLVAESAADGLARSHLPIVFEMAPVPRGRAVGLGQMHPLVGRSFYTQAVGVPLEVAEQVSACRRGQYLALMMLGLGATALAIRLVNDYVNANDKWLLRNGAAVGCSLVVGGLVLAAACYVAGGGALLVLSGAAVTVLGGCVWALGID